MPQVRFNFIFHFNFHFQFQFQLAVKLILYATWEIFISILSLFAGTSPCRDFAFDLTQILFFMYFCRIFVVFICFCFINPRLVKVLEKKAEKEVQFFVSSSLFCCVSALPLTPSAASLPLACFSLKCFLVYFLTFFFFEIAACLFEVFVSTLSLLPFA